ncbi:glycosyltransferase [Sphingomonas sp. BGYR3]|uniref:glycosyltransferase n=1 Tax=Sphingomonas sp. BGYR3 TaxID=2975483 RepID=UPI0021A7C2F1|nr:glycosyltransferase [Sphingomonas sp. BGYR3]MDG5488808.1 glycosyltransferase [Sphingomonas sp. BGYR3]
MIDPGGRYAFPTSVCGTIEQEEPAAYRAAALRIDRSGADLIWVQHEFGIYGGLAGRHLFELLDATNLPVAVTLHTVLGHPDNDQRHVMERLAQRAELFIVMAERARTMLIDTYDVPDARIAVIPHGSPDRPRISPVAMRYLLGQENRKTILTFGLLSRDKGIETMLEAMPAILDRCPETLYRIVGATHPHLVEREGEAYRKSLIARAQQLGIAANLRWEPRFLDEEALLDRIAAADVYVTPYGNPAQITSGTLAYAFALGKPIVSTPYVHAEELLGNGLGRLVGFGDVPATAEAVGSWLADDAGREARAARVWRAARSTIWPTITARTMPRLEALLSRQTEGPPAAPRPNLKVSRKVGLHS